MSEFLLELFSEEMPPKLQISARNDLLNILKNFFENENINYDKNNLALSTPNRLIIYFKNVQKEVIKISKNIRGPSTNSSEEALKGFLISNKIAKNKIYKKRLDNGEYYFFNTPKKKSKPSFY